jgi:small subunit ribosomal protein S20
MPNLKASIKDVRKTAKRTIRNKTAISEVRSTIKKVKKIASLEEAKKAMPGAYSVIDKAVQRGILKKNTGARYKSRLTSHVNKLQPKQTTSK